MLTGTYRDPDDQQEQPGAMPQSEPAAARRDDDDGTQRVRCVQELGAGCSSRRPPESVHIYVHESSAAAIHSFIYFDSGGMAHKNNRQITIDNTRKYRKTDRHILDK